MRAEIFLHLRRIVANISSNEDPAGGPWRSLVAPVPASGICPQANLAAILTVAEGRNGRLPI